MYIENLSSQFAIDVKRDMILRAERAMEHLLGAIQEGYYEVMVGSRGASGAVGALRSQINVAEQFLEGIIGFGKTGDYLKYTEYGTAPRGLYPAYSKTPPASVFAEWIRRAKLHVPDTFKSHALRARDRIRALTRLGRNGSAATKRFSRIALATTRAQSSRLNKRATAPGDEESKARLRWAWAMVIKRKRYGYRGLKVIERVAREQEGAIRTILLGQ